MSETSRGKQESDIPYAGAVSPFDGRTEEIGPRAGTSVLRTEDDLGPVGMDLPAASGGAITERLNSEHLNSEHLNPERSGHGDRTERLDRVDLKSGTVSTAVVAPAPVDARRGTADLGLFLLRVSVGAVMVVHGLQKLTGVWNGPGLGGFRDLLAASGYDRPGLLSPIGAVAEVAGGVLLIVGLATPVAAATVVAVMINAWLVRQSAEPGLQFFAPTGVEYESVLVAVAASIVLTGPGTWSLDRSRGWARRPRWGSAAVLVLGIAASVAGWVLLNGGDPLR